MRATTRKTTLRLLVGGALTLALAATAVGCSSTDKSADEAVPTATVVSDSSLPAPVKLSSGNDAGAPSRPVSEGSGGQSSGGGQSNPGGSSGGGAPSAPAPVIVSFNTPENIDCHNGNFQMFTASWSTSHATKVTISIDGPGVYDTYPANGETSLPFSCSSSHSFKLTAHGANGQTVSKTVTLDPRNVQSQGGESDEDTE